MGPDRLHHACNTMAAPHIFRAEKGSRAEKQRREKRPGGPTLQIAPERQLSRTRQRRRQTGAASAPADPSPATMAGTDSSGGPLLPLPMRRLPTCRGQRIAACRHQHRVNHQLHKPLGLQLLRHRLHHLQPRGVGHAGSGWAAAGSLPPTTACAAHALQTRITPTAAPRLRPSRCHRPAHGSESQPALAPHLSRGQHAQPAQHRTRHTSPRPHPPRPQPASQPQPQQPRTSGVGSIPVFTTSAPMSPSTAAIWARMNSTGATCTAATPRVFCRGGPGDGGVGGWGVREEWGEKGRSGGREGSGRN